MSVGALDRVNITCLCITPASVKNTSTELERC